MTIKGIVDWRFWYYLGLIMVVVVLSGSVMATEYPVSVPITQTISNTNYSVDYTQSPRYNSSYEYQKLIIVIPFNGYGRAQVIYYPKVQIEGLTYPVLKVTKTPVNSWYTYKYTLNFNSSYPKDNIIGYTAGFTSHENRQNNITSGPLQELTNFASGQFLYITSSSASVEGYNPMDSYQIYTQYDIYDSSTLDVFFSPPPVTMSGQVAETLKTQNPLQTLSGISLPLVTLLVGSLGLRKGLMFFQTVFRG